MKQKLKELQEEEEMSDDEIKKQSEAFALYQQKKAMAKFGEEKLYDRYTNLKAKEKEEADYLDKYIIDMTQTNKTVPSRSATESKGKSSIMSSVPASKTKFTQPLTSQTQGHTTEENTIPNSAPAMPAASRKNPAPRKNLK